jgi:hypothetical protein
MGFGFVLVLGQFFFSDTILNFYIRIFLLACCLFLFFINPLFNNLSLLGAQDREKKQDKIE